MGYTKTSDLRIPVAEREIRQLQQFRRLTATQRPHGAPEGNKNNLHHGAWSNRFLNDEERQTFDDLVAALRSDFSFNASADFIQVELVALYFLRLGRAQSGGDWEAAHKLDQMLRGHLKDLKATKMALDRGEPPVVETTPAEWASSLLERYAEYEKQERSRSKVGKRENEFG